VGISETVACPQPARPEIQRVPLNILDHELASAPHGLVQSAYEPYTVAVRRLGGRYQIIGLQIEIEVLARCGRRRWTDPGRRELLPQRLR
jgi:hypothetical protein